MTVFKGYMKVIRQSRWLILMYVAIFFACTLLIMAVVLTAGSFLVVRRVRYDSI